MKEKVGIVQCGSYEKKEVRNAIRKILEICDISADSFPEEILFKPNMLSARKPEDGITTHPIILEALGELLSSSKILIGDSPANVEKPVELYWEKCGYKKVSENINATLVKFNRSHSIKIKTKNKSVEIPITEYINRIPIINLPKLKTHNLTFLTSAVKNLYGLIPGFNKSMLHSKFISSEDFCNFIVCFYEKIAEKKIFFNLVDGVVIMEGNGPSAGTLRKLGYLIGGKNTIAVEMAGAKLLGLKYKDIPILRIYKKKHGLPDLKIEGKFTPLSNFKPPSASLLGFLGKATPLMPLLKILSHFFVMQPLINDGKCKKCYSCRKVCPVGAISKDLKIDKKKCINCLCCFEVCPYDAIDIKKSFLAKFFT